MTFEKSFPNLTLVAKSELAKELQLLVEALLLERATGSSVSLGTLDGGTRHAEASHNREKRGKFGTKMKDRK